MKIEQFVPFNHLLKAVRVSSSFVNQEEKPSDENYFGFICGYCSEVNNAEQQFTEQ